MTKLIAAAALAVLAFGGEATGGELVPAHAGSIDLGTMTGVAFYTVEAEGFHVIATLAAAEAGTPVRFEAVLTSGQSIMLSTPREAGMEPVKIEISRVADRVVVQEVPAIN